MAAPNRVGAAGARGRLNVGGARKCGRVPAGQDGRHDEQTETASVTQVDMDALLREHPAGFSLPGAAYHSEAAYRIDLDRIFGTQWLFACNGVEIPAPGDIVTVPVGADSVIVLRDRDGGVRAFHNTCRHRGSRICLTDKGHAARLVCPYLQWTYDLDGALIHANQMGEDFRADDHALAQVHVETVCGMIYICLAETPPDFARYRSAITPHIAPHAPERT
mgnify:CR=1 FL=1